MAMHIASVGLDHGGKLRGHLPTKRDDRLCGADSRRLGGDGFLLRLHAWNIGDEWPLVLVRSPSFGSTPTTAGMGRPETLLTTHTENVSDPSTNLLMYGQCRDAEWTRLIMAISSSNQVGLSLRCTRESHFATDPERPSLRASGRSGQHQEGSSRRHLPSKCRRSGH